MQAKWLIGIDEAGRGPLAGPVAVGVVKVAADFDWRRLRGVRDSKLLLPEAREALYARAERLRAAGLLRFAVAMEGEAVIDQMGIVTAVERAIDSALAELAPEPAECAVRLDGLLKAPARFKDQMTIIGGDNKEKVIGLASILAKVTRDRYMVELSQREELACYRFETHKGYATKSHIECLRQFGSSSVHRQTYCRNILHGALPPEIALDKEIEE